jgi:hypothetical protein
LNHACAQNNKKGIKPNNIMFDVMEKCNSKGSVAVIAVTGIPTYLAAHVTANAAGRKAEVTATRSLL